MVDIISSCFMCFNLELIVEFCIVHEISILIRKSQEALCSGNMAKTISICYIMTAVREKTQPF